MTNNYTPLDKETLSHLQKPRRSLHINTVLFGIATITMIVFAVAISVLLQQRAQAAHTITLPPIEITTDATGSAVVH